MNIQEVKEVTESIKKFEEDGWYEADLEHYGCAKPYSKKKYKFASYDNEDVVGILDLVIEGNVANIENLLVNKVNRGRGIGKSLTQFAESFAKEKKCTKIWLYTEEGWEAEKFYKKVGYKITGKHKNHYLGNTELIFTKFL